MNSWLWLCAAVLGLRSVALVRLLRTVRAQARSAEHARPHNVSGVGVHHDH